MPAAKDVSLAALAFTLALALAGCQEPQQPVPSLGPEARATKILVQDLARQLNMDLTETDQSFVKLTDRRNVVLLFLYQDGRLYINGRDCGPVGPIERSGSLIHVDPDLANRIRAGIIPSSLGTISTTQTPISLATIVVDPGHGGKDPGAISPLGIQEKDINLQVARRLAAELGRLGFKVIMTRDTDMFLELEERAAIANQNHADLFVSIHSDSSPSRSLNGYTVYTARSAGNRARWAARTIADAMASTGLESNGIRQADYRVLVNTNCPAVLVELGYLSNHYEAARLQDPYMQQRLARAIAEGLARYMGK